jgi:hypothetical protein
LPDAIVRGKSLLTVPRLRPAGVLFLTAALVSVPAGGEAGGRGNFKYGVVWYTRAPNEDVIALGAERFDLGVTGKETIDQAAVKAHNPNFEWFVYNSVTDNYVPPHWGADENAALEKLARARGWDPEEAYLHYDEDTRLVLRGDTLFVRGWPHGTASSPTEARIPVYEKDRRLVHFASPHALQLNKELIISLALDTPFEGTNIYPDGIFLDNGCAELFNFGDILSGGAVAEAGGVGIQSPAFQKWHWNNNLGPFLSSLRDTLDTSARWTRDHRPKRLMVNVANVWDDSYVTRHIAHILDLEFQYSPVRNTGLTAVDDAYHRDRLAADAGIATFYAATVVQSVPGRPGEISYASALLGNLAWYLVSRTETSIFFEMGSNAPHMAGWDTLTWRGCLDTAARQLGKYTGPPFTISQGTDPLHNQYVVKARRYENGMVLVRNRGDWKEGISPETAITVDLPRPMAPVSPSGRIGSPVQTVRLRNGEGAVLLGGS